MAEKSVVVVTAGKIFGEIIGGAAAGGGVGVELREGPPPPPQAARLNAAPASKSLPRLERVMARRANVLVVIIRNLLRSRRAYRWRRSSRGVARSSAAG